jgi:plasmid stabilization system protein ParE
MKLAVRVFSRAQADIEDIYTWLQTHSPGGASAWYAALFARLEELSETAASCSMAPEAAQLKLEIRQAFFRTRRGRTYRLLFLATAHEVQILRVHGPGQRPIRRGDLPLE